MCFSIYSFFLELNKTKFSFVCRTSYSFGSAFIITFPSGKTSLVVISFISNKSLISFIPSTPMWSSAKDVIMATLEFLNPNPFLKIPPLAVSKTPISTCGFVRTFLAL